MSQVMVTDSPVSSITEISLGSRGQPGFTQSAHTIFLAVSSVVTFNTSGIDVTATVLTIVTALITEAGSGRACTETFFAASSIPCCRTRACVEKQKYYDEGLKGRDYAEHTRCGSTRCLGTLLGC